MWVFRKWYDKHVFVSSASVYYSRVCVKSETLFGIAKVIFRLRNNVWDLSFRSLLEIWASVLSFLFVLNAHAHLLVRLLSAAHTHTETYSTCHRLLFCFFLAHLFLLFLCLYYVSAMRRVPLCMSRMATQRLCVPRLAVTLKLCGFS
jgi:hypothetical protein